LVPCAEVFIDAPFEFDSDGGETAELPFLLSLSDS